ncbi:ferredoxin [Nocardia sp. SYP-A9097]|uniref:ferredoxin n=1 Tax=Nocardia sp. SYP-A9097 TaxID=2663237 RepID=UPI00129B92A8|nr:ferredoxin [Nocardia sp. SYP-A9097]MRH92410.1 ferredoxin [Nocardia sp. SYP-A9097]
MTVHADERLLDGPMLPVRCRQCGAEVLARKSSWAQTSVQWNAAAMAACVERSTASVFSAHPLPHCSQLRESLWTAAESGALPVLEPPSE